MFDSNYWNGSWQKWKRRSMRLLLWGSYTTTNDTTTKSDTLFLYFSLLTADLLMIVFGASLVWTSPVLPQLKSADPEVNPLGHEITTIQTSLLAGLPHLIQLIGLPFLGKLADLIGRKNTLLSMSLIILLSNIAVAFGRHIYFYYIGISIGNLCLGLVVVVLPIYVNEVCEDHNRAKHGCMMMFFVPLGSLYGYLVGPITSVRVFTLMMIAPLIPQLICFSLLVPESPFYTASKGDKETTIWILRKLRNNKSPEELEQDYTQIEATLKSCATANAGLKKIFRTRATRRGFIIGAGCMFTPHLSGGIIILGFIGPIFNNVETSMSGNTVAILLGSVKVFFYLITVIIVARLGRRPLLLFSSFGAGVPHAFLAVFFYLESINSSIVDSIKWLPILCILVYISAYSLGMGSIPMAVVSEFFPNDIRSVAVSLIHTLHNALGFILFFGFPIVSDLLGMHYCIGIFSVGCFSSFIFMYFFLPETRGKNSFEIQEILTEENQ